MSGQAWKTVPETPAPRPSAHWQEVPDSDFGSNEAMKERADPSSGRGPTSSATLQAFAAEQGGSSPGDDRVRLLAAAWTQLTAGIEIELGGLAADRAMVATMIEHGDDFTPALMMLLGRAQQVLVGARRFYGARAQELQMLESSEADLGILERMFHEAIPAIVTRKVRALDLVGLGCPPYVVGDLGTELLNGVMGGTSRPDPSQPLPAFLGAEQRAVQDACEPWGKVGHKAVQMVEYARARHEASSGGEGIHRDERRPSFKGLAQRQKQYLEALYRANVGPEHAREDDDVVLDANHRAALVRAEDQTGEHDFSHLDDAVRAIVRMVRSTSVLNFPSNDIMKQLKIAEGPAEREFMLNRLLHTHHAERSVFFHLNQFMQMPAFETYKNDAGNFSQAGLSDRIATPSVGESLAQSGRAVPGVALGFGYGALASTPILGEMMEEEYGADARAFVNGVHEKMGVDASFRRATTETAIGAGNVFGTVGGMALTGGATNSAQAWNVLSRGEKLKTGAGLVYKTLELADNAKTVLDEDKSLEERVLALAGAGMEVDELRKLHRGVGSAEGLLRWVCDGDPRIMNTVKNERDALKRLQELDKHLPRVPKNLREAARDEADLFKLRLVLGMKDKASLKDGLAAVEAIVAHEQGSAAMDVADMKDDEVREKCQKIAEADGPTPGDELVKAAWKSRDLRRMRQSLTIYTERSRIGDSIGAYAKPLEVVAGMGR